MEREKNKKTENYEVFGLFLSVARKHKTIFENMMHNIPLHGSQHHMLVFLSMARPDISQKELAEKLEVSTAAVAVSLKKLEKNGYIKRSVSKDDSRFNEISITDSGRNILSESRKIFNSLDKMTFSGFSCEDLSTLYSLLKKMNDNLSFDRKKYSHFNERI